MADAVMNLRWNQLSGVALRSLTPIDPLSCTGPLDPRSSRVHKINHVHGAPTSQNVPRSRITRVAMIERPSRYAGPR
jgi:hypothetical protein